MLAPGRTNPKNSFIIPPHDLTAELEDVEFHCIDGGLMELFRAEKIGELENNSNVQCRACDKKLELARAVLIADTGHLIRLFECECGERIWSE